MQHLVQNKNFTNNSYNLEEQHCAKCNWKCYNFNGSGGTKFYTFTDIIAAHEKRTKTPTTFFVIIGAES
jgi:hypothetical protein